MTNSTRILVIVLSILVVLTGFNYFFQPFAKFQTNLVANQQESANSTDTSSPQISPVTTQDRVETYIKDLSLKQKIAQLMALPVSLNSGVSTTVATASAESDLNLEEQLAIIAQYKPGFVILFGQQLDFKSVSGVISRIKGVYPQDYPAPVIMVDHEGGQIQRLSGEGFTLLPSWQILCGMDADKRTELIDQSAKELKEVGVDVVLGPVVDVASRSSILKDRTCSGDASKVTQLGLEYLSIFSNYGVFPVIKHYPGIGTLTKDLHSQFGTVSLRESDMEPFDNILTKFSNIGVMVSHVGTATLNPSTPCSLSKECLSALITTYPKVIVVSDDLLMRAASFDSVTKNYTKNLATVALEALQAGNQVLILGKGATQSDVAVVANSLEYFAQESKTNAQLVDTRLERVLGLKYLQLQKE